MKDEEFVFGYDVFIVLVGIFEWNFYVIVGIFKLEFRRKVIEFKMY